MKNCESALSARSIINLKGAFLYGDKIMKIDLQRAAVSLGFLFAILHFVGVLLVSLTGGKVVEFAMAMHHTYVLHNFLSLNVVNLMIGTVIAGVVGALVGALFAAIWNQTGE